MRGGKAPGSNPTSYVLRVSVVAVFQIATVLVTFANADGALVLKSEATVAGEYVTLAECVESGTEALSGRTVYLGRAPEAGETRTIASEDVRAALSREGLAAVEVAGAESVRVTRATAERTKEQELEERFRTEAREAIVVALNGRAAEDGLRRGAQGEDGSSGGWFRYDVTIVDWDRFPRPETWERLTCGPLPKTAKPGPSTFVVRADGSGGTDETSVRVLIRRLAKAPAAAADLRGGARLRAEDVAWREIPAEAPDGAPCDPTGGRLTRSVAKGEFLTSDCVQLPPLVKRNDAVTAFQVDPATGATWRMAAKAREDGAWGARIRVELPFGGQVRTGIVRGAGMVELE